MDTFFTVVIIGAVCYILLEIIAAVLLCKDIPTGSTTHVDYSKYRYDKDRCAWVIDDHPKPQQIDEEMDWMLADDKRRRDQQQQQMQQQMYQQQMYQQEVDQQMQQQMEQAASMSFWM